MREACFLRMESHLVRLRRFFVLIRTHKFRAKLALRWIENIRLTSWTVLEVSRANDSLKVRRLENLSDYRALTFPRLPNIFRRNHNLVALPSSAETSDTPADLLLCLGILGHADEAMLSQVLVSVPNKRVLFSFPKTKPCNVDRIVDILEGAGYRKCEIRRMRWPHKEHLALAEKN
jgi:hypothetical protein